MSARDREDSRAQTPRLSLLDRLIDDDPDRAQDPPASPRAVHAAFREAIRRDLQNLLNSRQPIRSTPSGLKEVSGSVHEYGIPDLTGVNLSSKRAREEFLASLAPLVRRADARFKRVRVIPLEASEPTDRTLRFRVEATVVAEVGAEEAHFDFQLEPVSRRFR